MKTYLYGSNLQDENNKHGKNKMPLSEYQLECYLWGRMQGRRRGKHRGCVGGCVLASSGVVNPPTASARTGPQQAAHDHVAARHCVRR